MTQSVESPCVLVCVLDENDVCVGCGRLSAEVASWSFASNEEKAEIVKASSKRLKEIEER